MGRAIPQAGQSATQDVKYPKPHAVLNAIEKPSEYVTEFRFSQDSKLPTTWNRVPDGGSLSGFTGGGSGPFNFKLWNVGTAKFRLSIADRLSKFVLSLDRRMLLTWNETSDTASWEEATTGIDIRQEWHCSLRHKELRSGCYPEFDVVFATRFCHQVQHFRAAFVDARFNAIEAITNHLAAGSSLCQCRRHTDHRA